MGCNVPIYERFVRLFIAVLLAVLGYSLPSAISAYIMYIIAGILIITVIFGWCPCNAAMGRGRRSHYSGLNKITKQDIEEAVRNHSINVVVEKPKPAKKAAPKKKAAPNKKVVAKKKAPAKKSPAKKTTVKKAAPKKKVAAKKSAPKKKAPAKKATPKKKTAAKKPAKKTTKKSSAKKK